MCHAAFCLYLHCDVLIGRDAVGLSQLQNCGYSWVVGTHAHHPTTIIEGLKAAGREDGIIKYVGNGHFLFKTTKKRSILVAWTLVHLLTGLVINLFSNAVLIHFGFFFYGTNNLHLVRLLDEVGQEGSQLKQLTGAVP